MADAVASGRAAGTKPVLTACICGSTTHLVSFWLEPDGPDGQQDGKGGHEEEGAWQAGREGQAVPTVSTRPDMAAHTVSGATTTSHPPTPFYQLPIPTPGHRAELESKAVAHGHGLRPVGQQVDGDCRVTGGWGAWHQFRQFTGRRQHGRPWLGSSRASVPLSSSPAVCSTSR